MRLAREAGPRALLIVLLLIGAPVPFAIGDGGTRLEGDDRARTIERLQGLQRGVATIRATVVQRKEHPLLKEAATSEGILLFQRPDHVRWDISTPEHVIVVINRPMLFIYRPEKKEAERRDLRGDLFSRAAVDFLVAGMGLALPELEKRFQVDLFRDDDHLRIELTPRSALVAQAMTSLTLIVNRADGLPQSMILVGRNGGRTETTFTNVTVNPALPDNAFTLQLAPEVRIIDSGRPEDAKDTGR
jgi:outer membrane lipoprotein-sorting protein